MRTFSFRARLAATMSALILLICAAIWVYVPRKMEDEAIALISHKAETLGQLTAFTIHPSIHFQDRAALEEALSGTRQDKDVSYVIVDDAAGNRLASFHPERAAAGGHYRVTTPILDDGKEIARLQIGVSLERLNRQIMQTRVAIGVMTAIILAAGLLAAFLISDVMTRPLRELATAAQRIASGDLNQRVPARRGDEIGLLADAFNDMAAKVAERDASLRLLSRRLLSIQEEERIRIAREVHDELGQALTGLKLDLSLIATQLAKTDAGLHEKAQTMIQHIDTTIQTVRRIATELRPGILDSLGLVAALEWQANEFQMRTGIRCKIASTVDDAQWPPEMQTVFFRIFQETLTNVIRHAKATRVDVRLHQEHGRLVMTVKDNGRGISEEEQASTRSLGLVGMRERAMLIGGEVALHGAPGRGTTVTLRVPLPKKEPA